MRYLTDSHTMKAVDNCSTDQGVSKSGSPTPKDITPSISFATSKNFLMPEKGRR